MGDAANRALEATAVVFPLWLIGNVLWYGIWGLEGVEISELAIGFWLGAMGTAAIWGWVEGPWR